MRHAVKVTFGLGSSQLSSGRVRLKYFKFEIENLESSERKKKKKCVLDYRTSSLGIHIHSAKQENHTFFSESPFSQSTEQIEAISKVEKIESYFKA